MPAGCSGPLRVVDLSEIGPIPGYTPSEPIGSVNPKWARDCDPSAATEKAGKRYVRATLTSLSALAFSRRAARIARLFASAAAIACCRVSVWPWISPGAQMSTMGSRCLAGIALHPSGDKLPRCFPESPVDELGSEAAHEGGQFCLPGPHLRGAGLEGRKGLLPQLVGRHQSENIALGNVCRHIGLHRGRHEFDDLYAGFLQLEPQ